LIWQLFNAIEKGFPMSGDDDMAFLEGGFSLQSFTDWPAQGISEVRAKRSKIDKGIRIGSWGQLQG
jgi:alpha-L-fucosidase 2